MNVFLGDGASAGRFAATFAFGAAVAALGLAAALATRNVSSGTAPRSRRHRGRITSA
jgi:hypothetical protein